MSASRQAKLLRIGVVRDGQVVDQRVLKKPSPVSVGQSTKSTFCLPNSALPPQQTLFDHQGDGYVLSFSRGMKGRVELDGNDGERLTLMELSKSRLVTKRGAQFTLPLTDTARGRVVVGDFTILFQFVDAPPTIARSERPAAAKGGIASRLEWPLVYVLIMTFLTLGGTGAGLDAWWRQTGRYRYNAFELKSDNLYELLSRETTAEVKIEPPKAEVPEEKPDTEAEAEVAAEEEAPPEPPPRAQPKRVKVTKAERKPNRAKMQDKVRRSTILHKLGANLGGGELNTLANGIHAERLANAFSDDVARGVSDAREGGGLDIGGPDAVATDGRAYKGISAAEMGGDRIKTTQVTGPSKESRQEIKVRANVRGGNVDGKTGTGSIDKDAVARVFARRKGAIKHCYEKALKTNPNLRGKVTIRFTIGPAGRITGINAASNSTGDPSVASCIVGKVRGWRFDPPKGGSVSFSYPFLLDTK